MVTKEQAMACKQFKQVKTCATRNVSYFPFVVYDTSTVVGCKPINWQANGKCKVWKTRPKEFKLPIKHGLRDYGYLTHENAHLMEVV